MKLPKLSDLQPGAEPHGPKHEDCHGANEVECRPDPQPEHGRDCERSDDHVCATTTTSTTNPPTTTTTLPVTPTTITTVTTPKADTPSTTTTQPAESSFGSLPEPYTTLLTGTPSTTSPGMVEPLSELPATGMEGTYLSVGIFVTATGLILRKAFGS